MKRSSGYWAMIFASILWGNFILLFAYLRFIPALDIVAHRVIWGLITLLIWLGINKRLSEIKAALKVRRTVVILSAAALMVMLNWLGFVWAAGHGHGLEAGLGYFIFPIVSILFGALINREKLSATQRSAILIAAIGVLILTIGLGRIPWISLFLATTFAAYGLIKSRVSIGAVLSVTIETVILAPLAILWLVAFSNFELVINEGSQVGVLLIGAGFLTSIALIAYSFAAKTIGLVSSGILFFLNPTLQVINAHFILGEPFTFWHKLAFPLIALACAIYCYDLWKRNQNKKAII